MSTTTMTSREFNQDTSKAKKAANQGPVFITDRGKPAHVLLSIAAYEQLVEKPKSLAEVLRQKEGPDFDFEPPRMTMSVRPAEFD
jgi:prevent-host-death family protein